MPRRWVAGRFGAVLGSGGTVGAAVAGQVTPGGPESEFERRLERSQQRPLGPEPDPRLTEGAIVFDPIDETAPQSPAGDAPAAASPLNSGDIAWLLTSSALVLMMTGSVQLFNQAAAVVATWVLAAVATFVILKVVDLTIGLRVSDPAEIEGLDLSQHGEVGYNH